MTPSPEASAEDTIVVDPALGNPDAVRLRAELQRGDWKSADAFLEGLRDWDARAFFVGVLSDWDGRPPWLDEWCRVRGGTSAIPALVRGAHSINWAWEARGGGTADTVDAKGAQLFLARLQNAERDFEHAASLAPDDPTPWGLLIATAIGRSAGDAVIAKRFDQAVRRDPLNRLAHARRLVSLTWKWGGSHDAMFQFAREVVARTPAGNGLHLLLVWAHLERWLAFRMERDTTGLVQYMGKADIKAELLSARDRFLGAPLAAPALEMADRNTLAFVLWMFGESAAAAEEMRVLGTRVARSPWMYWGDPAAAFVRARAECLGIGDAKTQATVAEKAKVAVEQARDAHVTLDGSWESLAEVDKLLARYQELLAQETDRDSKTSNAAALAMMFGAYWGEVVRDARGGCWIPRASADGLPVPALVIGDKVLEPMKVVVLMLLQRQGTIQQALEKYGLAQSSSASPASTPRPSASTAASEAMRAKANRFVQGARESGYGELRYDEASLSNVDAMVRDLRAALAGLNEAERRAKITSVGVPLGAYVGETLCRGRDAAWSDDMPGLAGSGLAAVNMGGFTAMTISAAFGLLGEGATDLGDGLIARSVSEYYTAVSRMQQAWFDKRLHGELTAAEAKAAMSDDPKMAAQVYGIAATAIMTGAMKWGLQLDFSPASLQGVESVLEELHKPIAEGAAVTPEQITTMATVWGVYLGEVIRRHRGGKWSYQDVPNVGQVACVLTGGRGAFPISRVEKRLRLGSSQSVVMFYAWISGMAPVDEAALAAKPSESLTQFVRNVLRVALSFVPNSGRPMDPCLFYEKDGKLSVESYAAMSTDKAMPIARQRAAAQPPEVPRVAFAYDGYVSIENQRKRDAILVECHERGSKYGFVFSQIYERGPDGKVSAVGDPETSPGPAFLGA